jgi:hypothetical protein
MKKIFYCLFVVTSILSCKDEKETKIEESTLPVGASSETKTGDTTRSVTAPTALDSNDTANLTTAKVDPQTAKNIYKSGDSMLAAFNRKDWPTFIRYHHPSMTKMMGGPTAFSSFVSQQMKQIPAGATNEVTLGRVLQVVKTPKDLQCVVEQHNKIIIEGLDMSRTTYLIGESLDDGKTWTFLDASVKSGVTPKGLKPDLSSELKIPATKKGIQ